ncbi:hypothetical protein WN943_006934 [Citrus x changshan-huyou]
MESRLRGVTELDFNVMWEKNDDLDLLVIVTVLAVMEISLFSNLLRVLGVGLWPWVCCLSSLSSLFSNFLGGGAWHLSLAVDLSSLVSHRGSAFSLLYRLCYSQIV